MKEMTEVETAKAKIRAEMAKEANNAYVQAVGAFLLEYLEQNPGAAGKISAADKTIAKSLDVMRSEAQKKKVGNVAVIAPQEGFAIVLKYFGINDTVLPKRGMLFPPVTPRPPAPPPAGPAPKPVADTFDIKLEDLL